MLKIRFALFLLLVYNTGFTYDCRKLPLSWHYNTYDWIFVGNITRVSESSYNVEVLEVFKGKIPPKIIGKSFQNEVAVNEGVWLLYADSVSHDSFKIDWCSPSRSFRKPYSIQSWYVLPLPPKDYIGSPNDEFILSLLNKSINLNELYYEITNLRTLKKQNNILSLTNKINKLQRHNSELMDKLNLNNILLVILSTLLIGVLFIITKLWYRL